MNNKIFRRDKNNIIIILVIFILSPIALVYISLDIVPYNNLTYSTSPFLLTSSPEKHCVDSNVLADMLEKIKKENLNIRSIIIIKDGALILECYVHPYDENVLHDVKSVSKSIISALLGIALQKNIIKSLDQRVSNFLPEYFQNADSLKKTITLEHLISMSSGLEVDENGPAMNKIISENDVTEALFNQPMVSRPGEKFKYCTLLTHTLSIVFSRALNEDLLEFAKKHLFNPLGINNIHWEKDNNGYYFGGDKLWLTPRGMARFGYLYLNNGSWKGSRILTESWIKQSTENQFLQFPDSNFTGYGYSWWLKDDSYFARGAGGQIISIYPSKNLVVVLTGADSYSWEYLIDDYIIPAASNSTRLPDNHTANARLKKIQKELKSPEPKIHNPLPEIAKGISGKTYILENNDLGFSEFTFSFSETDDFNLVIRYEDSNLYLNAGLDGVYRVTKNIKWGIKKGENIVALRGSWLTDNRLFIDFQEVGEPFYFDVEIEFSEDRLNALFTWKPFNWKFNLKGSFE